MRPRRRRDREQVAPSNRIAPASADTIPEMVLNNVVLPAPLGPTTATSSPASTRIDTWSSTGTPP
jgi:hypothetical protein